MRPRLLLLGWLCLPLGCGPGVEVESRCGQIAAEVRGILEDCGVTFAHYDDDLDSECTDTLKAQFECLLGCYRQGTCSQFALADDDADKPFRDCKDACSSPPEPIGPPAARCPGWDKPVWGREFNASSDVSPLAVDVDGADNIGLLLAIPGQGTVDLGAGPVPFDAGSAFADANCHARFDSSGAPLWGTCFAAGLGAWTIALLDNGDELMAGSYKSADLGGGPLPAPKDENPFAAKLDASGKHLWSKGFPAGDYSPVKSIAVDTAGGVVLAGHVLDTIDFGNGVAIQAAPGEDDLFVARLDASGNALWAKRFGVVQDFGVALDAAGNTFLAGDVMGELDLGGGVLTGSVFVAKLDPSGEHLWSKAFEGDYGGPPKIDSAGNVLLAGTFYKSIAFGGPVLSSSGTAGYVAKLDTDGGHVFSTAIAGASGTGLIGVGPGDETILGGWFDFLVDFGAAGTFSAKSDASFVAKIGPDGAFLCGQPFEEPPFLGAGGGAVDSAGQLVLTAWRGGITAIAALPP